MNGRKIEFRSRGTTDIILINPDGIRLEPRSRPPGVAAAARHLHRADARSASSGWTGRGAAFGSEPSTEILFLASGAIAHRRDKHQDLTAFGSSAREAPETLTALEPSELLYVKLPTF